MSWKVSRRTLVVLGSVFAAAVTAPAVSGAGPFQLTHVLNIIIPPETGSPPTVALSSFDIGWFDAASRTYLLADRTHAGVDVVDGRTNYYQTRLTGFVGNTGTSNTSGPNGVLLAEGTHEVWAGDGNSTVKVFDLNGATTPTFTISTGGSKRADELAYDPRDHLILVANDADSPPFVTFISTHTHSVVGRITYDFAGVGAPPAGHGEQATDGLEQPVWDPATQHFYFSVPATTQHPNGQIDVIDPRTMQVTASYPFTDGICHPQGLVLGPDGNLLVGCGGTAQHVEVVKAHSGALVATIPQVHGVDEAWYNPGDQNYYLGASNCACPGPVLGVINARTNTWVENVGTGPSSHSVAANPFTNQVYVPLVNEGVGVYANTAGHGGSH